MLFVVSLQTFGLNAAAKHLQYSRTAGLVWTCGKRAVTFPLKLRGSHLCWVCHTPDMKVRHGDHSLLSSQHIYVMAVYVCT